MDNGFLSQEEINALLAGDVDGTDNSGEEQKNNENEDLTDIEKDILGEIGNISMGSASTALSTIIGQTVNITTPTVAITTLNELQKTFEVPNIALDVQYVSGIDGGNLFVMKITDAAVIANLMMGGNGILENSIDELSEIEISAVSEAMNQMIGSAATSMATMFAREVNISPPTSGIWDEDTQQLSKIIDQNQPIVRVAFNMTIGELVDSKIMQVLPMKTARTIIDIMMGNDNSEEQLTTEVEHNEPIVQNPVEEKTIEQPMEQPVQYNQPSNVQTTYDRPANIDTTPVNVKQANFAPLQSTGTQDMPRNIDLILDVPLDISVVLGRTKKNIRDILELGVGSLIELDKLAEEPVEILVNGKKVALGEVVVVDENFGVRITSIISSEDRVRTLGK